MPQAIVCSICSRVKSSDEGLLPARERYQGSHISKVEGEALKRGVPFFILSGLYGLLAAEEGVPNYDYLLTNADVLKLADKIQAQLYTHNVGVVYFHTKFKPQWEPYGEALSAACKAAKVEFIPFRLDPND
jgi:hypothetical protein